MSRKNKHLIVLPLLVLLFTGCRSVPMVPGLSAHKIDIQQGNVITQDMLEKLQPGMTRGQVRFVLGTPLLVDPFRNDRWDYIYLMDKQGQRVEQRQIKVYFQDDKMLRYEGEPLPAAAVVNQQVAAPEAKPVDKRGFFARLFGLGPKPTQPAQPAQAAPASAATK